MRKILITNDDGITSDGIIRLAKVARDYGEVWVVAPATQRSAASHSISLRDPITVYPAEFPVEGVKAFAISGTPADCVRLGVLNIVPGKPDMVFSGINYGYNVATDLQYSATAGAAFEAAFQNVFAIAFSEGTNDCQAVADRYIREAIDCVIDKPLGYGEIWNINFPGCPVEEVKGILEDRTVSRSCIFVDHYNETKLEDGGMSYMVQGTYQEKAEQGTDLRALFDKYVSIGRVRNIS